MLYHISLYLQQIFSIFNIVHYVSFRAMAALLTSLIFSFIFGTWFINRSKQFFRAQAREFTPERHKDKDNMPTMGGIFIITVVLVNSLLWCNWSNNLLWIFVATLLSFGAIGFIDDWSKIKYKKGISSRLKFFSQVTIATCISFFMIQAGTNCVIAVPFFKNILINLGYLYIPWCIFIIVGCSNAVNLTDGLDGLAIGSLIPNFATFSLICYVAGHFMLANYLHIPYAGTSEIAIIGATLVGASIGFLWYNAYPAQIFMGDVGSLALGAALALMALMSKQELLLIISGGLFIIETLSVIIQVISFKYLGRRMFRMAPLHHHFELLGWQESKITVRFGIISLILCLTALMTLKIR